MLALQKMLLVVRILESKPVNESHLSGVYPILLTPFDEDERVDVHSLQSLVDFELEAGVHGLGIALGSEVMKLTEAERAIVTRTVTDRVAGRVPVVVNTGGTSTVVTIHNSRQAVQNGADAVMIIPPSSEVGSDALIGFYQSVSGAVDVPIFIQDLTNPHIAAKTARDIAEACSHVQYVKVESHPTPIMVAEVMDLASDVLTVFGGGGGNFIIEELRRGSQGTMPGCSNPEAFVDLWHKYSEGDKAGAIEAFYRNIVPINRIAEQGWGAFHSVHKEILRQRGVIRTSVVRGPVRPLGKRMSRDLQLVIDELYG